MTCVRLCVMEMIFFQNYFSSSWQKVKQNFSDSTIDHCSISINFQRGEGTVDMKYYFYLPEIKGLCCYRNGVKIFISVCSTLSIAFHLPISYGINKREISYKKSRMREEPLVDTYHRYPFSLLFHIPRYPMRYIPETREWYFMKRASCTTKMKLWDVKIINTE